jgi:hypothetical protein
VSNLKILSFLFASFSSDYHKLCKYTCTGCNDVRLNSQTIRSDLSQVRRVPYVVVPVTCSGVPRNIFRGLGLRHEFFSGGFNKFS